MIIFEVVNPVRLIPVWPIRKRRGGGVGGEGGVRGGSQRTELFWGLCCHLVKTGETPSSFSVRLNPEPTIAIDASK